MLRNTSQSGSTVGETAIRILKRFPDQKAFTWDGGELTYRGALDKIGQFQHALHTAGLRPGDVIAVLGGNRAEVWCSTVAVQASDMTLTWLHPMGSLDDHLFQLVDSEARCVIVDEVFHETRGGELTDLCADIDVQVMSLAPSTFAPDLQTRSANAGSVRAFDTATPARIASITYTGGTSGKPKGVVRRHPAVVESTVQALSEFEFPARPRYLNVAPMSHIGGTTIVPTLSLGGTVHLMTGFDPERVLHAIDNERINMALLVPSMIYGLLDVSTHHSLDTPSLELMLYGASPMSIDRLADGIERFGPIFSQLYGQTECFPISVLRRSDHDLGNPDLLTSCGFPTTGAAVALLDEEGNAVDSGAVGELCVRSATSMESYWKLDDLTQATLANGWLHTGDIGRMDERGYLHIVGRKKEMIISGGFNVYPREVEDALMSHESVSSAAVFGIHHEKWGEAVTAEVVLKSGCNVSEQELISLVKQRKGSVQTPKILKIVDSLPLTPVGKVDKRAIAERYQKGLLTQP